MLTKLYFGVCLFGRSSPDPDDWVVDLVGETDLVVHSAMDASSLSLTIKKKIETKY